MQPAVFSETRLCVSTGCSLLTSAINISTEHEGREGIIKIMLEGFDPKLAGVLLVAAALKQRNEKAFHICVENSVK